MSASDRDSKKEKLRVAIQQRVDKEEHAFRLVEKMVLLDCVDKEFFLNAGAYITVSQYKDVTEERAITKLCGYPLCNNRVTQVLKQTYKISVREKKVYDIRERKNFCSNKCYKSSKYFESQLSAEPVWMRKETIVHPESVVRKMNSTMHREATLPLIQTSFLKKYFQAYEQAAGKFRQKLTSLGLKVLDDSDESMKKLSGSGEEVLMTRQRSTGENVYVEDEREDVEYEHAYNDRENEEDVYEHEDVYDDHVATQNELEDVGREHEIVDREHEDVRNQHEIVVGEHENFNSEHDRVNDDNEYDNIHKHIQFDNDLGSVVERVADVKIDFDFTDSDDDDDDNIDDDVNDIDNIDYYANCVQRTEKDPESKDEKKAQHSDTFVHDELRSPEKKIGLSDDERQKSKRSSKDCLKQSKNQTVNFLESDISSVKYSCDSEQENTLSDQNNEPTNLSVKTVYTNEMQDKEIIRNKKPAKSENDRVKPDGSSAFVFGSGNEKEQIRKMSVYKVYQVLLEWRSSDTEKYLSKSLRNEERDDLKETRKATDERGERREDTKSLILPSIDSKSQMAIRGKIVSEKVRKAIAPILSRLSISMADISSQLSVIVKTFRFTNTNIVLKPFEWTLVALILLLVLVRCNSSLKELLSTRQKDLHSLLSNKVDDEDDVDRLLGVFNFQKASEPSVIDCQRQFDMEEMD